MSYDFLKEADDDFRMGYEHGAQEMKNKAIEALRVMGEETRFDITTDALIKAKEIFMRELNSNRYGKDIKDLAPNS